jgi:hypothetical protein
MFGISSAALRWQSEFIQTYKEYIKHYTPKRWMNISHRILLSGSVNITDEMLLKLRIKFSTERECEHVKVGKWPPFLFYTIAPYLMSVLFPTIACGNVSSMWKGAFLLGHSLWRAPIGIRLKVLAAHSIALFHVTQREKGQHTLTQWKETALWASRAVYWIDCFWSSMAHTFTVGFTGAMDTIAFSVINSVMVY